MGEDFADIVVVGLVVALVSVLVWNFWARPGLWTKFIEDMRTFIDAFRKGPPDSPA